MPWAKGLLSASLTCLVSLAFAALLATFPNSAAADATERLAKAIYIHFIETYFSHVGATAEIEQNYPIVRWGAPIAIATNLAGMDRTRSVVADDITELAATISALGHDMSVVDNVSDANVRMVFFTAGKDEPEKVYKVLDPSIAGYDLQFKLAWRAFSKRNDCAMGGLPSGPYEIGYAFAFINIAQPDEKLVNCTNRMLFGLLGFQESETYSVSPTLFDIKSAMTSPSEIDLLVLLALADPRLKKGMIYDEKTQEVLREVSRSVARSIDAEAALNALHSTE